MTSGKRYRRRREAHDGRDFWPGKTGLLNMLEALEEVMGELDVEGLPCPLCGRDLTIGHRRNCLWHVVESAVRKARGEE